MPCDTVRKPRQTKADREREIKAALAKLEAKLATQAATMFVGPNGAIGFTGWENEDRDGVTDACAYRALAVQGSWGFRQAKARAEALAGRKVDERLVSQGVHSHDGGKTWGKD